MGKCILLVEGEERRPLRTWDYVHCPPALRHGAGVEEETTSFPRTKYEPWRLERPDRWEELPWAD